MCVMVNDAAKEDNLITNARSYAWNSTVLWVKRDKHFKALIKPAAYEGVRLLC